MSGYYSADLEKPSLLQHVVFFLKPFWIPLSVGFLTAGFFTLEFRHYLPITQGWVNLQKWWFPLTTANLAFHEAGHIFFGFFNWDFLTSAGGTLMQLLMPSACLFHFWRQSWNDEESSAMGRPNALKGWLVGIGFCIFWIGLNLVEISFYAADAKQQVLILISGMSGSEGGGHDWGYMFGQLGWRNYSVGIGQSIFFLGVLGMAFAVSWGIEQLVRWLFIRAGKQEPGT